MAAAAAGTETAAIHVPAGTIGSWTGGTAGRSSAAPQAATRPAPDAGRSRRQARAVWFAVAAAINVGLVAWPAGRGEVGSRAVDWSLVAFCIAVAARHDGIVRGVFVLGRLMPSYRLHQLAYHLGQLHRAMAMAGLAWLAVAAPLTARSSPFAGMASAGVLAILAAVAWTARDRVRHTRHNRFELVHRFGGWAALGILAIIVPVQAAQSLPPGSSVAGLLRQPAVLLLATLVILVAHPWLGVRRRPAEFLAVTSEVVVVALPGRRLLGEFVRVSREGREWHCFAVATTGSEGSGRYCLVIRRAGDWTERLASDIEHGRAPIRCHIRRARNRDHGRRGYGPRGGPFMNDITVPLRSGHLSRVRDSQEHRATNASSG